MIDELKKAMMLLEKHQRLDVVSIEVSISNYASLAKNTPIAEANVKGITPSFLTVALYKNACLPDHIFKYNYQDGYELTNTKGAVSYTHLTLPTTPYV